MNIIDIGGLKPASGGSPKFEGGNYGVSVSFFVVTSPPGKGADKHRHPYEEVFVVLEGDIEVINDGKMQRLGGGNIVVIPANTWHEFKNRADHPALMVNIHPVPTMIQEDWT
jgi:quercetin dioxygenase-like cupin family protein